MKNNKHVSIIINKIKLVLNKYFVVFIKVKYIIMAYK